MSVENSFLREKLQTAWEAYENNDLDKAEELCQLILFESLLSVVFSFVFHK